MSPLMPPMSSYESDGVTIRMKIRMSLKTPDEAKRVEYLYQRRKFSEGLLEAIKRTNSKVVVEFEETSSEVREYDPDNLYYGPYDEIILTARLTPVKYRDVQVYSQSTPLEYSYSVGKKRSTIQKIFDKLRRK